jgi:hypothetical protein
MLRNWLSNCPAYLEASVQFGEELREIVLAVLRHPPVSDILTLSAYTPSVVETTPITLPQPVPLNAGAGRL